MGKTVNRKKFFLQLFSVMTSHSTCMMCIFKCSSVDFSFYVFQGMSKMSSLIILLKSFKEYIDSPTMALKNFVIYCRLAPKCKYAHQNLEHQIFPLGWLEKTVLIALRYLGQTYSMHLILQL
jgi:hypothetical protein